MKKLKIYKNGIRYWYLKNKYHRIGGPSIEDGWVGIKIWYQNNKLHRNNGPAIEDLNKKINQWWINGRKTE